MIVAVARSYQKLNQIFTTYFLSFLSNKPTFCASVYVARALLGVESRRRFYSR